jgi:hypothetical protein
MEHTRSVWRVPAAPRRHSGCCSFKGEMNALETAALVLLLMLPLHLLVQRELRRLSDPGYIRRHGVTIESDVGIERRGDIVGSYWGAQIHAEVVFMEMVYRFDRIAPKSYRYCVGPRELYLDPGLVYVTQ